MKLQFAKVCRVCNTVLHGPLGYLFHLFGIKRSSHNPNVCNRCDAHLQEGKVVEVTVLFADLTGFTQLTNELGAERTYAILSTFFKMANEVLVKHDAYIDKYIGDAVMAFFNLPIQSPQHALHAVQAALELQRRMPELTATTGRPLQARIGLASGYAHMGRLGGTGDENFTVIGDVVNLASRLETLANPGEIVADAAMQPAVAALFPTLLPEQQQIRGFQEPAQVFRLNKSDGSTLQPPPLRQLPAAAGPSVGLGSVLMSILGAPCALSASLSPLALVLGIGTTAGAAGTFTDALDAAQIRIPIQLFGVIGAFTNLYVVWRTLHRQSFAKLASIHSPERRKLQIVSALAIVTLLAVVLETYHHLVTKGLSYFEPLL